MISENDTVHTQATSLPEHQVDSFAIGHNPADREVSPIDRHEVAPVRPEAYIGGMSRIITTLRTSTAMQSESDLTA